MEIKINMVKFSDIPQLTNDGHYTVDIPLDYLQHHIGRYIEEFDFTMDQDYQRNHVWTDAQQIAFVEHLLRGGKHSNIIRLNMPGWMRRKIKGAVMEVVDGKQRLTACLRFLNNEIPAFGYYYDDYEDNKVIGSIYLNFKVNDLRSRKDILQWYLEINTGGTDHTNDEIENVKNLLAQEKAKE